MGQSSLRKHSRDTFLLEFMLQKTSIDAVSLYAEDTLVKLRTAAMSKCKYRTIKRALL